MSKYIGNRYVPLHCGKWDKNKSYESLSVVIDDEGNSYTSIKNVPSQIELSDTNFWVLSGIFNLQYASLKTEIDNAKLGENSLEELNTKIITELNKKVSYPLLEGIESSDLVVDITLPYGDVKRYGAKGNGISDDTDIIQFCLNNFNISIRKSYIYY